MKHQELELISVMSVEPAQPAELAYPLHDQLLETEDGELARERAAFNEIVAQIDDAVSAEVVRELEYMPVMKPDGGGDIIKRGSTPKPPTPPRPPAPRPPKPPTPPKK